MPVATTAPPTQLESNVMEGLEALTECPECKVGTFSLLVYRQDGRVKVACGICERARYFADAHTPAD